MASFEKMPALPNTITDPAVRKFLETYYAKSNEPELHDDFADLFTNNGEYNMNAKMNKGKAQILAFRKAIWSHIPKRDHYPTHIFTSGDNQMELMGFGEVGYEHHMGHSTDASWVARYELVKEQGEIKLKVCHIIVDSVPHV